MSALASGQRSADTARVPGSFRDPAGFLFRRDGVLYRQVDRSHAAAYDQGKSSGLYDSLVGSGRLIPHDEVHVPGADPERAHRVLRPEEVAFISYPYEWCFGQLRDAALLTLDVQRTALDHGMSLRDASAYNVQFHRGRPVIIDTLSFEPIRSELPWIAYGQFCRHFLAPLALMAYRDVRLGRLLRVHIDGVPLELASTILPRRARWRPGIGLHIHQHSKAQRRAAARPRTAKGGRFSGRALVGLVESLQRAVRNLEWRPSGSNWIDYYERAASYSGEGAEHKRELVRGMLTELRPATVWDLGANVGVFGRIAAEAGATVVCFESDDACVEASYRRTKEAQERAVLPLVLDLANPSPGLGWGGSERESLTERGPADVVLALALVHHLAVGNNVPLEMIAGYLSQLGETLLVEFVPKDDPKVQLLLASRDDVFPSYTSEGFEQAFSSWFAVERAERIRDSARTLYLMRRRPGDHG